jgi:GT2 family glycosyltransferase
VTVSIVVPAYITKPQQLAMSVKCISLAKKYTALNYETIIVETGSDCLRDEADIHIYEKDKTTATRSMNNGFKIARGDYVVLLTNDVYVTNKWLECLLDCFKLKDCGAATLASNQFNHVKEDKIEEGNWFSVAMIKREVFDKIGYFDEDFTGIFDDTDWLLRMYKAGWRMYRNFNCVVEHLVGQTHYISPQHQKNYERNRILYNKKHEGCTLPFFLQTR